MSSRFIFHIAGVTRRSRRADQNDPALTGVYMESHALLGYAGNVLEHTFNDPELAAAVRERCAKGPRRKRRTRRTQ